MDFQTQLQQARERRHEEWAGPILAFLASVTTKAVETYRLEGDSGDAQIRLQNWDYALSVAADTFRDGPHRSQVMAFLLARPPPDPSKSTARIVRRVTKDWERRVAS